MKRSSLAIQWKQTHRVALAQLFVFGLAACGPVAFDPQFADNQTDQTAQVTQNLGKFDHQKQPDRALVLVETDTPTAVLAYDLVKHRQLWSTPLTGPLESRISCGVSACAYIHNQKIVVQNLANGAVLWKAALPTTETTGLTAAGDLLLLTGTAKGAVSNATVGTVAKKAARMPPIASLTAWSLTDGQRLWQRRASGHLGAAIVRYPYIFVPFQQQSIAVLHLNSGNEITRVRFSDTALTWVRSTGSGVAFGNSEAIYWFDENAATGSTSSATQLRPHVPVSMRFPVWFDGYDPILLSYTAYDQSRLLWDTAGTSSRSAFAADQVVALHHRYLFSYVQRARDGQSAPRLSWAFQLPRKEIASAHLHQRYLYLASKQGDLIVLESNSGRIASTAALNQPIRGASFIAHQPHFMAPSQPAAASSTAVLMAIISDPDRRFLSVKPGAIDALALSHQPEAASILLGLITAEQTPPQLARRAGEGLITRNDVADIPQLIAALKRHSNHVRGERASGVAIVADVLAHHADPRAIAPLIAHLNDPATPMDSLLAIVRAVAACGDGSEIPLLRSYLLRYKSWAGFGGVPEPLVAIAEHLLKNGPQSDTELMVSLAKDPTTIPPLRSALSGLVLTKHSSNNPGDDELNAYD